MSVSSATSGPMSAEYFKEGREGEERRKSDEEEDEEMGGGRVVRRGIVERRGERTLDKKLDLL